MQREIDELKENGKNELTFDSAVIELGKEVIKKSFEEKYPKLWLRYSFVLNKTVETVFGKYPQSKEGKDRTPIEWRILAKEDENIVIDVENLGLRFTEMRDCLESLYLMYEAEIEALKE